MDDESPKIEYFSETISIIKNNGLKLPLAVISVVSVCILIKTLVNYFTSEWISFAAAIFAPGLFAFYYNQASQAKGNKDIKHAMWLDWLKLSPIKHLIISFTALGLAFFFRHVILPFIERKPGREIEDGIKIAYD